MRQAGILAAAGIVALEKMVDRLPEDHRRARDLARRLSEIPHVIVEDTTPPSNMVYFRLADEARLDGAGLEVALAQARIKIHSVGPRRVRLVVHYWIDDEAVARTAEAIRRALA
jgi:threonine aldolase